MRYRYLYFDTPESLEEPLAGMPTRTRNRQLKTNDYSPVGT